MAKSRSISTFILTLTFTILMITACETQHERTGEAPPSPTATITTSPSPGASPGYRPGASPTTRATGALTPYDREFLTDAARGAAMEVQLGNTATQKATSDEVKRFGQRMATDHTQEGQAIRQMASNPKFTLPPD